MKIQVLDTHRIPPALVINMDETGMKYVNHPKRTRDVKGAKRVKIVGLGGDKCQFTVGFGVTEDGQVACFAYDSCYYIFYYLCIDLGCYFISYCLQAKFNHFLWL